MKKAKMFSCVLALGVAGSIFAAAVPVAAAGNIEDGLVAHYDFNSIGSDNVVKDVKGSNNGKLTGAETATGKFGGAVKLTSTDGSSYEDEEADPSRVELPVDLFTKAGNNITIAMLIKPEIEDQCVIMTAGSWDNQGDESVFMNFWLNHGKGPHMALEPIDSNDRSHLRLDDSDEGKFVKQNEWQWLVYTQNGTSAKLYIDGNLVVEGTMNTNPADLGKEFKGADGEGENNIISIGSSVIFPGDKSFAGLLDDVRIYNRALSLDDINALAAFDGTGSDDGTDPGTSTGTSTGTTGTDSGTGTGSGNTDTGSKSPTTGDAGTIFAVLTAGIAAFGGLKLRKR